MFRRCGHAILVAAAFLAGASANWNDTSPGINLDKLPHPALTEIRSGILKQGQRVIFDRITALAQSNGVRLRGRAKSGKPWEAHICYGCFNEVWRADLDGNGIPDYVFFGGGPYFNGRNTPLYSLTILLMDRERLPVPFFFPVYYGERGEGIKHLVGQNGRAELLISSYDEATSDPHVGPFCSGHWITQLYRFRNLAVEEVRGEMGGIDFPFVHDWTYRGGECAELEKPIPIQGPTFNEQGTSAKGEVTAHIRGLGMNGAVTIDPVAGCKTIYPEMIVYDRPRLRLIGLENPFTDYNSKLATEIENAGVPVKLRGINRSMGNDDCSVNLMWAAR